MNRARAITGGQAFAPLTIGGTAATLDLDFRNNGFHGVAESALTVTRTGIATSGLYTDATGSSYTSFAPNTLRRVSNYGVLREVTRTQYLGVTDTPATQTTSSLGTGSYTLWVIGSGTATPSAGTATITGAAAASAGAPNTFTVTVAGTVTVTVSGSLTRFQLENGAFATSYIPNLGAAGTTVARSADVISLTSTSFTSWFTSTTAGTIFAEFQTIETTNNNFVFYISNNSYNERVFTGFSSTNFIGQAISGGVTTLGPGSIPVRTTAVAKSALAYEANNGNLAGNGTLATADVSGALPTGLDRAHFGSDHGGVNGFTGVIRRVAYFPTRLSDANIQALTS